MRDMVMEWSLDICKGETRRQRSAFQYDIVLSRTETFRESAKCTWLEFKRLGQRGMQGYKPGSEVQWALKNMGILFTKGRGGPSSAWVSGIQGSKEK